MSLGQMIALASGTNPVKMLGSDKFLTRLQQTLDGWCHEDPPTSKNYLSSQTFPNSLSTKVGIACRKPLINVPYKRTFGVPDQGQTLDV
jgi:hypothetical protein